MPSIQKLLEVPFAEKDKARNLGGRWLPQVKRWFVPTGMDLEPFRAWLNPRTSDILHIPSDIYIAEGAKKCRKCHVANSVYAIGVKPADLTSIDDGEMPFILLDSVEQMPPALSQHLLKACPHYKRDYSKTANLTYYMNHCAHCGSSFGDFYLHNEPGGTFCPTEKEEAAKIRLFSTEFVTRFVSTLETSSVELDPHMEGFKGEIGLNDLIWSYAKRV